MKQWKIYLVLSICVMHVFKFIWKFNEYIFKLKNDGQKFMILLSLLLKVD